MTHAETEPCAKRVGKHCLKHRVSLTAFPATKSCLRGAVPCAVTVGMFRGAPAGSHDGTTFSPGIFLEWDTFDVNSA